MTRTASSPKAAHSKITFPLIKAAKGGDIDAMTVIQRHYDPYIRSLSTVSVLGTSYLNTELYDRLKTRLIMSTLKFRY